MIDSKKWNPEWIAVWITILGALANFSAVSWWAGRIDQRVATIEARLHAQDELITQNTQRNNQQDSALAVNTTQYSEITRRLDRIDNKLERIR